MTKPGMGLRIGKIASRTGTTVSAIRFYEAFGLISAGRDAAGRRVFAHSDIRRVSFVLVAQKLGFPLKTIKRHLDGLPNHRTPTSTDWKRIGGAFGADIDDRIAALQVLRSKLSSCIGCGCLSLDKCALYNADDAAGARGPGARYLMGDTPGQDGLGKIGGSKATS